MDIQVLGPLQVSIAGRQVPLGGPRTRTLLAALLVDRNRTVSVDRLVDAIWGNDPPAKVANALQARVAQLRRALADAGAPPLVVTEPGGYRAHVPPGSVDADRFEQAVAAGSGQLASGNLLGAASTLAEALAAWTGPAFHEVADLPFARAEAQRLGELRLGAFERWAEAELAGGDAAQVAAELAGVVLDHPLRERMHELLMTALYRGGRQAEALAVYDGLRRRLADELGIDPSPSLQSLHSDVLRHAVPAVDAATASPSLARLPAALTTFVGRREELRDVVRLLDTARLVTLVGPGGTGKTRLAIEVARDRLARHRDGVWLVELAAITDPDAVASEVAATLGATPALHLDRHVDDQRPVGRRLADHVRDRDLLIVLDNCEHLLDGAATAVDLLLQAGPRVRLLATSREGLRAAGEHLWAVPPLAVPPARAATRDEILQTDAAQLFVDRAAAVVPGFEMDAATATAIGEVCRRLDGLPLAIELAAARCRALPVSVLNERLGDRFRLLIGGSRTATRRQQTLEAVVEWSYRLLDDRQRQVFRCLGVFVGGCDLVTAERVVADVPGDARIGIEPADVLPLIGDLVDKSLVVATPEDAGVRYGLLETLREFALRRLVEAGDADVARDRHAAWCLGLAASARRQLHAADQVSWLRRLDQEHDNLRAALKWLVARDLAAAAELAADLAWYWWLRDHREEALAWLGRLLAESVELDVSARGRLRTWHAFHASFDNQRPDLGADADEELAALAARSPELAGESRLLAAFVSVTRGEVERARMYLEEARVLADQAGVAWVVAGAHLIRGQLLLLTFDLPEALSEVERADAAAQQLGDRWLQFQAVDWLAQHAQLIGDYQRAEELIERALHLSEDLGLSEQRWLLRASQGMLAMLRDDLQRAARSLDEAFTGALAGGLRRAAAVAANGLGMVARRAGEPAAAMAAYRRGVQLLRPPDAAGASAEPDPLAGELLAGMALAAAAQGDGEHAEALAAQAAETAGFERWPLTLALILEAAAAAAVARDDHDLGARRLGGAAALREQAGLPLLKGERFDVDRLERAVRVALGEDAAAAADAAGAAAARGDVGALLPRG